MYTLQVTLLKAENLPASDFSFFGMGGKSDPYFTFKVGRESHKSSWKPTTLNPEWLPTETFTFEMEDPKALALEVHAYDYDRLTQDDLLGSFSLALYPFLEKREPEVISYELDVPASLRKKGASNSVVFLEISLKGDDASSRVLELWENQRYHVVKKWITETVLPNDRKRWSSAKDASISSERFEEVAPPVPEGMEADGWTLDVSKGDDNGWLYATSFQGPWQPNHFSLAMARRRKWINQCTAVDNNADEV